MRVGTGGVVNWIKKKMVRIVLEWNETVSKGVLDDWKWVYIKRRKKQTENVRKFFNNHNNSNKFVLDSKLEIHRFYVIMFVDQFALINISQCNNILL